LYIERVLLAIEKQFVGQEKLFFKKLSVIEDALKHLNNEDIEDKKQELLQMKEKFRQKFDQ
jgi:hypothetical protein